MSDSNKIEPGDYVCLKSDKEQIFRVTDINTYGTADVTSKDKVRKAIPVSELEKIEGIVFDEDNSSFL